MFESCIKKQKQVLETFSHCHDEEEVYAKIVELGKELTQMQDDKKHEEYRVKGCQSTAYLSSHLENGKIIFEGAADALISAGLINLLIKVYSGEAPETVIKCEPEYLKTLGLDHILTPGRANGLYSMLMSMKKEAIKYLMLK